MGAESSSSLPLFSIREQEAEQVSDQTGRSHHQPQDASCFIGNDKEAKGIVTVHLAPSSVRVEPLSDTRLLLRLSFLVVSLWNQRVPDGHN